MQAHLSKMNGKGKIARFMLDNLPKMKGIIEKEYGVRFRETPFVVQTNRLNFDFTPFHVIRRYPFLALPSFYANLKTAGRSYYIHKTLVFSPLKLAIRKMLYLSENEKFMKGILIHELTHFVQSEKELKIKCLAKKEAQSSIEGTLMREGLAEYSKSLIWETKIGEAKTAIERIKQAVGQFIEDIIYFRDNLQIRGLDDAALRKTCLESPSYLRKIFRLKYRFGREFVRALAGYFNDNKKLFRHIVNLVEFPTLEQILFPEKYIKRLKRKKIC
ncbi:MAG: hypothetical protein NTY68_05005 [Candidatus Micrarchaeota archaeon]|nr:hypothetical protein [Candidatus Micrarchaeota archaeon]